MGFYLFREFVSFAFIPGSQRARQIIPRGSLE